MITGTAPANVLALDQEQFQIRSLFPTPLICAPLDGPEALNEALKDIILRRARHHPSCDRSNDGGWQSSDDFAQWAGEPGAALLDLAGRLANSVTGMMVDGELLLGAPEWKISAWANVNGADHCNKLHHHPAAYWSGIYWVDVDETCTGGQLEASDPRGILPGFYAPSLRMAIPGHLSAGGTEYISPKSGTMVLFPSWLAHSVLRHTSSRPRISIAFNLSV